MTRILEGERWSSFELAELEAIEDGLLNEAELDPSEDPSFPARVAVATRLLDELQDAIDQREQP